MSMWKWQLCNQLYLAGPLIAELMYARKIVSTAGLGWACAPALFAVLARVCAWCLFSGIRAVYDIQICLDIPDRSGVQEVSGLSKTPVHESTSQSTSRVLSPENLPLCSGFRFIVPPRTQRHLKPGLQTVNTPDKLSVVQSKFWKSCQVSVNSTYHCRCRRKLGKQAELMNDVQL